MTDSTQNPPLVPPDLVVIPSFSVLAFIPVSSMNCAYTCLRSAGADHVREFCMRCPEWLAVPSQAGLPGRVHPYQLDIEHILVCSLQI